MRREFVRFLLAGAANTLFSYLLYLLLLGFMGYLPAYSIAYCAGIVCSYCLNVRFVFRTQANLASFLKFPAVYVIQYVLGAATLWLLVGRAGIPPELAMAAAVAVTIPVTYLASRFVLNR